MLAGDERRRARPRQAPTLGEERREQRGLIFRPDDAVGGKALDVLEEAFRVEAVELVEIGAGVVHPVPLLETGGGDRLQVPLLRAENEDVSHSGTCAPALPESYRDRPRSPGAH